MADDLFSNEPAADFSRAADRESMTAALATVRASFGQHLSALHRRQGRGRATHGRVREPGPPGRGGGIRLPGERRRHRRSRRRGQGRLDHLARDRPQGPGRLPAARRLRASRPQVGGHRAARVRGGEAVGAVEPRRLGGHRLPRVLRAGDGAPGKAGATAVDARGAGGEPALLRAARGRGRHRPVELPAGHQLRHDRGGHRHGRLRGLQAFQPVPRHRAPSGGPLLRSGPPARRVQLRALRRRRSGRSPGGPP